MPASTTPYVTVVLRCSSSRGSDINHSWSETATISFVSTSLADVADPCGNHFMCHLFGKSRRTSTIGLRHHQPHRERLLE